MKKSERIQKEINNYLFDHYKIKLVLQFAKQFIIAIFTAAIFAFGFCCFVTPCSPEYLTIVTGGISGLTQNINLFFKLIGIEIKGTNVIQAYGYLILNIPILIFGFFKVGKRFSIFSAINVVASTLFIRLFQNTFATDVAKALDGVFIAGDGSSLMSRTLLAGVFIGISSALAFRGDISCGGLDVIVYYYSLKKSTSVGKYTVATNAVVVTLYSILLFIESSSFVTSIISLLYSILYLVSIGLVVDTINIRNKKVKIEFITTVDYLGEVLIANFPHGATTIKGNGVYSGAEKNVIIMVVSSNQVKEVVNLAKKVDEHVFISVHPLIQVYGNFFIKPIE